MHNCYKSNKELKYFAKMMKQPRIKIANLIWVILMSLIPVIIDSVFLDILVLVRSNKDSCKDLKFLCSVLVLKRGLFL